MLPAALRGSGGRARRRLRTRRVPRPARLRAASAARGIDLNHEMAEVCRARGLDVTEADAVGYLVDAARRVARRPLRGAGRRAPAARYLLRFLELAFHKLRPGGRLVLETLNPACWVAFFESYIRDITHVWPLHPETLQIPRPRQWLHHGIGGVPLAGAGSGSPAAHRCGGRRFACPGRSG